MEVDLIGVGAILAGLAAVIGSLASFYLAVKNTKKIASIDRAVNSKAVGQQTIAEEVSDIHDGLPE